MFRAPAAASLLSVYAGTGAQLLACAGVTMVFAVLGFLSPANRGGLMTAMLLLFVFMGLFAGYASARLYKTFKARARTGGWAQVSCPVSMWCVSNESFRPVGSSPTLCQQ